MAFDLHQTSRNKLPDTGADRLLVIAPHMSATLLDTVHCTAPLAPAVEIDLDLIRRFDQHGPRYTSYPTADRFVGQLYQEIKGR